MTLPATPVARRAGQAIGKPTNVIDTPISAIPPERAQYRSHRNRRRCDVPLLDLFALASVDLVEPADAEIGGAP